MKRIKVLAFVLCSSLIGSGLPMVGIHAEVCQEQQTREENETDSETGEVSEAILSEQTEEESLLENCTMETVLSEQTEEESLLKDYIMENISSDQAESEELLENCEAETEQNEESVEGSVDFIMDAVSAAAVCEAVDMDSQVMRDFLTASDQYDQLDDETRAELPPETESDIWLVRSRIQEVIRTCGQVTASSNEWYVRTNVEDGINADEITELLKAMYPSCSPKIVYHKNIYYTDIRNGDPYRQMGMISLTFPKPQGYEKLINPKVFTLSDGELRDLSPAEDEHGNFFVERARTVSNVVVADLPIALTGITLNQKQASVNAGQKITLKVNPLPEDVTEKYTLTWKSSNPKVASVDKKGVVRGIKNGTATITVSVKGKSRLQAKCKVSVVQGAHSLNPSLSSVMNETKFYMLSIDKNPTIGSEWFVLGLARSGMDLKNDYFTTYYNHFANYLEENHGVLTNTITYTAYSKAILTMTSIGKDARKVAGYNLFKPLADFDMVIAQGINGPVWALLAVNSNPQYTFPKVSGGKNQTTEQKLVDYIVSQETPNGGWNMLGDYPDSDMTGMAIQALAPYYRKAGYEEVTAAIDRALEALSTRQNASGGYSTMGVETSESCSQVITALCALGIDPQKDERFVKGGYWTVENLLAYHISGSGFMHVKAGSGNNGGGAAGEVNGMATEQAYYAMTAYQRLKEGKTSLYDMSDMAVKKGGKGDGNGTGLEVSPTPSAKPTGQGTSIKRSGTNRSGTNRSGGTTLTPKRSVSSKTDSGKKKTDSKKESSKKKKETESDGWEFEAEEYDGGTDDWDETIDDWEEAEPAISPVEEEKGAALPPAIWLGAGVCLGMSGTGGGMLLRKRIRKRKGGKV